MAVDMCFQILEGCHSAPWQSVHKSMSPAGRSMLGQAIRQHRGLILLGQAIRQHIGLILIGQAIGKGLILLGHVIGIALAVHGLGQATRQLVGLMILHGVLKVKDRKQLGLGQVLRLGNLLGIGLHPVSEQRL